MDWISQLDKHIKLNEERNVFKLLFMFGNVLGVKTFTTDLAPNVMIGPTKALSVTFNSKIVREYIASNRPRYDFNMKNLIFSLSFEMYPYRDMITSSRFEMYPYKVLRCTPTET